ncbi:hypothetical protein L596_003245 [Steinernema carpocapsae]|uniref:ARF7 effector protein C-terminal domain-containing protein n=1 Tax=Steinernema carpocapsae TaxID=34508 RepID=A0A4U8UTJ4_STECR|nr:hypothetical protein L596_003245 [Steinernema carpocapsae]
MMHANPSPNKTEKRAHAEMEAAGVSRQHSLSAALAHEAEVQRKATDACLMDNGSDMENSGNEADVSGEVSADSAWEGFNLNKSRKQKKGQKKLEDIAEASHEVRLLPSAHAVWENVEDMIHDAEGRILDPRTGERIFLCDCFRFECPGCLRKCRGCGGSRCLDTCQRGRTALVWVEFANGRKARHPFYKQYESEEDEFEQEDDLTH